MFLRQIFIETRKTFAHPALWIGLGGLSLLLAGFVLVEHAQIVNSYQPANGGLERDLIDGLAFYGWIGSLVYAICAAVIVAFDYPDRSIQLWLMRGQTRPTLLFARLVVVLFVGLLLVFFVVAALLGMASISRMLFFGQVDVTQMNWAALLPAVLRVFCGALPYLMLTALLAVISRSPLFAAGGTVIYATVLEKLLMSQAHRFPVIVRHLPGSLGWLLQELNLALDANAVLAVPAMPELRAAAILGLMALAISGVTLLIFTRQDLGG